MRAIGKIPDQQRAAHFSEYLLAQGITSRIDEEDGAHVIWVRDEEKVQLATEELQEFLRNPQDEKYQSAAREAEKVRQEQAKKQERASRSSTAEAAGAATAARGRRRVRVPVTLALLFISIAVGVETRLGDVAEPWKNRLLISAENPALRTRFPGLPEVQAGEVWRLVTPIFLHFHPLHLIFNAFMLLQLGVLVESRRGSLRMALIVLATAIVSNLAQYYWNGPAFGGMSGVVYGLFGYCWMKTLFAPRLNMNLSQNFVVLMLLFLFVFMTGAMGEGIANAAHLGGFLTGLVIGIAPHLPQLARGERGKG